MSTKESRVCHNDSDLQTRTKTSLDKQLAEYRGEKKLRLISTFKPKRKRIRIGSKINVSSRSFDIPIPPNRFTEIIGNYVNTLTIPNKFKENSIQKDYKQWLDKVSKYLPKGHVYKEIYINLIK